MAIPTSLSCGQYSAGPRDAARPPVPNESLNALPHPKRSDIRHTPAYAPAASSVRPTARRRSADANESASNSPVPMPIAARMPRTIATSGTVI